MKINIQSLKNGLNVFEFDADVAELCCDGDSFHVMTVSVQSRVDKGEQSVIVTSDMRASIRLTCDSCLEEFVQAFDDSYTLVYTADVTTFGDDEMVRLLSKGTATIDLTEGLRESILLCLPMKFRCSESCKGLCDQCGANLNREACQCTRHLADPRWEKLKNLFGERAGNN